MALPQSETFQDEYPLAQSCPSLNEVRLADEIENLSLEVKDGAVLHAHRIMLAARVPFLQAALKGQHSKKNSLLKWPMVPLRAATVFIDYMYTGQMEMTEDIAWGIVALARMMNLPLLENLGVNFVTARVNLENLSATWDFAKCFCVDYLVEQCISLLKQHFEEFIFAGPCCFSLSADMLLSLIRSDDLPVDSEAEVAAISSWLSPGTVAHNERLKLHVQALLKEVRWLQMTDRS